MYEKRDSKLLAYSVPHNDDALFPFTKEKAGDFERYFLEC